MEATENTLHPRSVGGTQYKLLSDKYATGTHDELKYVDLDNSLNICKTNGNVSSPGEGYHDVVQKCCSNASLKARDKIPENEDLVNPFKTVSKCSSNTEAKKCMDNKDVLELTSDLYLNENVNNCLKLGIHEMCTENLKSNSKSAGYILPLKEETVNTWNDNEDLQYTDIYLSRTIESDDDVIVLSDDCVPCLMEDESHYITTHEILLSELSDHEVDNDIGAGSCWDIEADNQMYSFVDYASFDCDETRDVGERGKNKQGQSIGRIASRVLENDRCGKATCNSSECLKTPLGKCNGNSEGQIHLSIKTTSCAIHEPSNIQENENTLYHAKHAGDVSRYVFRGDAKADRLCDDAKCLIAAPGWLHFGSKLKGKHGNEYSSSASSAVSELDDADKEVRNLTARAFKSLAYPYFDSINVCTSSDSSASERGLGINSWSTFVDLKYGNISQGRGKNSMSHKMSSCTMAKKKDDQGCKSGALTNIKPPPSNMFNLNGNPHNAASKKKIALMGTFGQGHSGVITLTETLNICCNVKSGVPRGERRSKCQTVKNVKNSAGSRSTDEVTNASPGGQGGETRRRPCNARETMEDTHKKAIFASSLLKNVISKKMQFEHERKMERGEICEPYQVPSPCFVHQDLENLKENGTTSESRDRQSSKYSEAGSDNTIVCVQELGDIVDSSLCDAKCGSGRQASYTNLKSANEVGFDTKKRAFEAAKSTLLRSKNSAFRSWRDGELEFQKEQTNYQTPEWKLPSTKDNLGDTDLCADSGTSKLAHLFVPNIQLPSSEREVDNQLQTMNYLKRAPNDQKEGEGMRLRSDNTLYVPDSTRTSAPSKSPEIKLKSLKYNKSDKFNISKCPIFNLVCNGANLIKTADDSRCHALAPVLKGHLQRLDHLSINQQK
ncbi:uncharacterized protein C4orf54 homolog isoform X3 [Hypomesus transpacificus]|uniref:uncharacterized protein C4orf54 homolog isoform X3 n=1 Tax=Hypomesus transpacificus TaxID=137520 RepID=UPI001F0855CB|nr:uncharacterized protein C4orf54 homolog isoform X3 [Hypomesus transpacificus]